eukprot:GHVO01031262.1.p1 GENE.GHVO01031262.1~~GHVO01031262.1.p1  ORF type:complete len:125 (+),score=6.53 GHVO01031262.1:26-400(+)
MPNGERKRVTYYIEGDPENPCHFAWRGEATISDIKTSDATFKRWDLKYCYKYSGGAIDGQDIADSTPLCSKTQYVFMVSENGSHLAWKSMKPSLMRKLKFNWKVFMMVDISALICFFLYARIHF